MPPGLGPVSVFEVLFCNIQNPFGYAESFVALIFRENYTVLKMNILAQGHFAQIFPPILPSHPHASASYTH